MHLTLFYSLGLLVLRPVLGAGQASSNRPNLLGPVTDLNIVNQVIAPDGFSRSTVLAGVTFPGPLIAAEKGDNFKINVVNKLNDTSMNTTTSIHWHGIFQRKSSWADGTLGVTQCAIKPDKSFLYQFNTQDQTGTYWYHSHVAEQYCDGLRGPLVIYDPDDPHKELYDVDDATTVITLADWFHEPSTLQSPVTESSTLINGLGRYAGGPSSPLAVINVEEGKRYRFRIVGMSCGPWFNFTIDGHPMTVIETDGSETEPLVVDSLSVFPGQRYSVVVTANQPVGNFWIRALPSRPSEAFDGGINSAILRYAGAPEEEPTTEHGPYLLPYADSNAHALINPGSPGIAAPGKADVNINLVPSHSAVTHLYALNNASFSMPTLPVLLQILDGARHPSDFLPQGSVYVLPPNKVVEISIPISQLSSAAAGGPHPFHLHGHAFDVVRAAGSTSYNFKNPVRRDVVSIGGLGNDNVTFRFTTDNPGPWFLHCHIETHLNSGFAVVMAEAPSEAAQEVVPDYWRELCD